ncbi:MAG: hypothetical protein J0G30_02815 [Actinomycetales bacterium]|nr:hypothetical protein [Actinomycetales bacterium]
MKKLLAVLAAIAIGAGLATVAVAAPATASHPVLGADVACAADGTYTVTWSVQNSEPEAEYQAVIIASSRPGVVPVGTVLSGPTPVTFTETVESAQDLTLDVTGRWPIWGVEKASSITLSASQFPANCSNPPGIHVECGYASTDLGRPLVAGDTMTLRIFREDSGEFQIGARVVPGSDYGFDGLGLVPYNRDVVQLSTSDVLLGHIDYTFGVGELPGNIYRIEAASSAGGTWTGPLDCGSVQTLKVSAVPTVAPPTCDTDGSLVITDQPHIIFTVTPTFAGPGTYTVTAAVDNAIDYVLDGPSEWKDLVVEPKLVGWDCETQVVPVTPTVTSITACDMDGSVTLPTTEGVLYELIEGDGIQGAWKVRATPLPGYHFGTDPSDPQEEFFSGDLGAKTTCAISKPPKATSQVCDTVNGGIATAYVSIPAVEGLIYSIGGTDIVGPVDYPVQPGTVVVDVRVASADYTLVGDDSFTFTITAPATACDEGLTITALAYGEPETCDTTTGQLGDGDVVIPHTDHVSYDIDGTAVDTSGPGEHRFPYPQGDYTVTATADPGWIIVGTRVFVVTVDEFPLECEQHLTPVTPSASVTAETCSAGKVAPGAITVALMDGVSYTLLSVSGGSGAAKTVGTVTSAPITAATTSVSAGTYLVQATADPGYVIDGPDSWTLTVAAVDVASCGTHLAFTGAAPLGLTAAALTLLGVGGVLLLVRRLRRRDAAAGTRAD